MELVKDLNGCVGGYCDFGFMGLWWYWMGKFYKLELMSCELICWETLEVEYIICEVNY